MCIFIYYLEPNLNLIVTHLDIES